MKKKVQHSQTASVLKEQERTDAECIQAIRSGEKEGWETLVQRHYQNLLNLTTAVCGNQTDGEDAVQETFIAVFQGLDLFDVQRPLKPWLNTIAVRRALNICRMQRNLKQSDNELSMLADEASLGNPSEMDERLSGIYRFLQQLKPEYRTILLLKYYQSCSYTEIARILEWSEETVKSRLYMARTQLRQIIQNEEQGNVKQ